MPAQRSTARWNNEQRWLIAIVVVGLLIRAAAIFAFNHVPESDELDYRSMALNLVNGNGIVDAGGNQAFYNAGYPLFVLAPAFFLFGEDLLTARLANPRFAPAAIITASNGAAIGTTAYRFGNTKRIYRRK